LGFEGMSDLVVIWDVGLFEIMFEGIIMWFWVVLVAQLIDNGQYNLSNFVL
jgi:hypothetical protein